MIRLIYCKQNTGIKVFSIILSVEYHHYLSGINVHGFDGLPLTPAKVYQSNVLIHCSATNQLPMKCRHHEPAKF